MFLSWLSFLSLKLIILENPVKVFPQILLATVALHVHAWTNGLPRDWPMCWVWSYQYSSSRAEDRPIFRGRRQPLQTEWTNQALIAKPGACKLLSTEPSSEVQGRGVLWSNKLGQGGTKSPSWKFTSSAYWRLWESLYFVFNPAISRCIWPCTLLFVKASEQANRSGDPWNTCLWDTGLDAGDSFSFLGSILSWI